MTLSDFLLFALPAIFLTDLSKGGFGGALGGIAVPLPALATSPKQAAAVMLLAGLQLIWKSLCSLQRPRPAARFSERFARAPSRIQ